MKRTAIMIGTVVLVLTLSACDVAPGGACNQIGSQHTNKDGTLFTCAENLNTGKGYWYKGKL